MCNGKGCCKGGCIASRVAKILVIAGGLNWGLIGLGMLLGSNLNVLNMIFGSVPTLEAIVYLLVGVAAIVKIFCCRCKKCKEACATCAAGDTTGNMENKM